MIAASGRSDVDALLARVGLGPESEPPTLIDADMFYDVVETIVTDGDDALAYRYAATVDIDRYGVAGLAFKTATTIRVALERAERYVALLGDAVSYELRPDVDGAAFVVAGRPAHRLGVAVANEGAIAALVAVCRQAAGTDTSVVPVNVSFAHRPPGSIDAAQQFFGCPVRYGQDADAFRLDHRVLDAPRRVGA